VTGRALVEATAAQLTSPIVLDATTVIEVGASGTDTGVVASDTTDQALYPTAFTARTENTYAVPFARPVTV
jgi:hypothetical protein